MKASASIKKKTADKDVKKDKKDPIKGKKFPFGKKDDKKAKKDDKKDKKDKKKVNETTILSFKDFMNESADFRGHYDPTNFENEDEIKPMEGSDEDQDQTQDAYSGEEDLSTGEDMMDDGTGDEGDDPESFDDNEEDAWHADEDDFGSDDETEPEVSKGFGGESKMSKLNTQLATVNSEIGKLLDEYKTDHDVQKYKKSASPLLAKRKEIQAQLDSMFNIGLGDEDEVEAGMDDDYSF